MKITETTTLQDVINEAKVSRRLENAEKEGCPYMGYNVEICSRNSLEGQPLCRSSYSENEIWVRLKNSRFGERGLKSFKIRLNEELDIQKIRDEVVSLNKLDESQNERGKIIDAEIESVKTRLFYIIGRFANAGFSVKIHSCGENEPPDGLLLSISEAEKIINLLPES